MRDMDTDAVAPQVRPWGWRPGPVWASLPPLMLLLHPYNGLVQDARIYLGRGVADHDPAGAGRDIVFADDGQTGFTLLRGIVRTLLDVLAPRDAAMLLALSGSLLWLGAAAALARSLAAAMVPGEASDRIAWAAMVAVLALPAQYGAFDTFAYAETIATPRVFAEAAVLAGLAMLLGRRRAAGLLLLVLALALHPLMALPGLGIAAVMTVCDDRRWLVPLGCIVAALLAAAASKLPLAARLFETMDATWWSILRSRCFYLFPSLWPADMAGHCAPRAAAALLAGGLMPPRARACLWGAVAIALCGVAVSLAFGDLIPGLLVTQVQPWRALWLLAVLGNAGLALAAVGLWRRETPGRLILALLAMAWCAEAMPELAVLLSLAALALGVAVGHGLLTDVPLRALRIAGLVAALMALRAVALDAVSLAAFLKAASAEGGAVNWPLVLAARVQSLPLVVTAVLVAVAPLRSARAGPVLAAALALGCVAAALLWDGRTAERRGVESGGGARALREALGPAPGEVLWIDEGAETWFIAGRPAFFNALQGAPILFSRAMAIDWAARGALLQGLGLARLADLAPWASEANRLEELELTPEAVMRFCADPRHPAGLVAPGAQLAAVPPTLAARLWRPGWSSQSLSIDPDGAHWRSVDVFTVVRCAGPDGIRPGSLEPLRSN